MIKSEIKFVNERNNKPTAISPFGSELSGGESPESCVTTENKKQKALKTHCFQGFFAVRVLITDLENISPAGIPVPYTIWII